MSSTSVLTIEGTRLKSSCVKNEKGRVGWVVKVCTQEVIEQRDSGFSSQHPSRMARI